MADAGDHAADEFASQAAYNNPRRFGVPPTVNNYACLEITRQVLFVDNAGATSNVLSVPATPSLDNLFYVDLGTAGIPTVANLVRADWSGGHTGLNYDNLRAGSAMATALHSMYDNYRIRSMKFIIEPCQTQPIVNTSPMDIYVWWIPNHYTVDLANPFNEFGSFADLRDAIPGSRITKVSHKYGQTFAVRCVPQMGEKGTMVAGDYWHDIPMPWLNKTAAFQTAQLWTPMIIFRRPFGQAVNFAFSVCVKAILEYREGNPTDEN